MNPDEFARMINPINEKYYRQGFDDAIKQVLATIDKTICLLEGEGAEMFELEINAIRLVRGKILEETHERTDGND